MNITLFPEKASKADLKMLAEHHIAEVIEGRKSALELRILASMLKQLSEYISDSEELREAAITERSLYGKDETIHGLKIDVKEVGVKYDYSNSELYNYLNGKKNEADKHLKEACETLKTLKMQQYLEFNGASFECNPPLKTSTTNVVINLNK